jgi:hypothetical protein
MKTATRYLNCVLILALWFVLFFATITGRADDNIPIYGEPGDGRIEVLVRGDFLHPGAYWLPAGTKLPALLKLAQLRNSPPIILIIRMHQGERQTTRFWTKLIQGKEAGKMLDSKEAHEFSLEDGDIVKPSYIIL